MEKEKMFSTAGLVCAVLVTAVISCALTILLTGLPVNAFAGITKSEGDGIRRQLTLLCQLQRSGLTVPAKAPWC